MARANRYNYTSPSSIDALINSRPEMVERRRQYEEEARLAAAAAEERARRPEEGEPEGFLSSAPSDLEVEETGPEPAQEQGWLGGVVNDAALSLRTGARQLTSGVLGAPVNVANLVTNPLPLRASQWVANRFSPEEESTRGINTVMDSLRISQPEAIRGTQEMIANETLADQAEYSSATLTEARAKYEDAKGFLDTAKVLATQPRLTSAMALEVIPQLLVRTPGSVAGTVAGQAALAGSMVESEVAADLAKKVAAGEITREQAERTASNAFAFSAGVNSVLPSLHGGGMAVERALAGQGSRRTASGIVSDVAAEGALGGLAEAADEIITNVSTDKPWDENVARSFVTGAVLEGGMAAPTTVAGSIDASRRAEVEESSRFNSSIDQSIIEQGNAMLAAREAEQAAADAQVNTARLQRAEEAIRQNEQNKNNAWANASTPDMFGADPDIVGTFEEQEALRQYEMEQRALSLQERRRAFEAMERSQATDRTNFADVVEGSHQAQFDARDAEQARVRQSQEALDPAFNPPVESQMASQLRAALSNRGVEPAVVEEVVQEVKAPASGPVDVTTSKDGRDYRYTLATDGNAYTYYGDGNIMEGREVWSPRSQEALDVASSVTNGMLALRSNEVTERAAYSAANKEIVAADTEGRPMKFSMVMVDGRGAFEGQQFPSTVVAPAVGVDGTQRIYEYVLSPDKHLRRTYRDEDGVPVGVEYLATNKETGSREWSNMPPGMLAPNMEWGPAVDIETAGEEITAQANNLKPVTTQEAPAAPAARTELPPTQGNGFIGPARGRRTEPNVGENRTTRVDERDALPFPEMARTDGVVQEPTAVVEDVAPEQMELEGMDVAQPTDTVRGTLDAARKKREERQNKDRAEALKKAKAKHTSDRNKFLEELLERNLTPSREEAALAEWMESNPVPTEATVTVAPAAKPVAVPDATAVADKAVQSAAKNRVAAWRRGRTVAANRAMAEARARKLKDDEARKLVTQRVEEYDNRNPNPETAAPSQAAPTQQTPATKVEPNDPRVDEQLAAIRLFDTSTPEAELRADIAAELSAINLDQDINPVPEDKRASIEDVRALLGVPSSGNARSARRAIGNGIVQLVTEDTMGNYRSDINQTTQAWYDGEKMYVIVDRLNKDNLMGQIMGAIAHEGKHASDASGKGAKGIGHFIGVDANRRLRTRIEEAASRGDQAAVRAVARASAAAKKRPGLPGLYEVELPAYYITEIADRPTTLYRGLVSSIRVGVNNLLGRKDVNVDDIAYMADRMVENLSYDSYAIGSIQRLLDKQGGVTIGSLTEQVEGLDQGMYGGRTEAIATTPNGSFNLVDDVAPEGTDYSEFGQVRKVTAFEDGQEVGSLIYANDGTPPTVEVAETHRRRGVGTAMLKMAREQGGVLGEGSSGIRGRGSEYRTSDGQAFRSNANENNAQLDYVTALNQDMDDLGTSRFSPKPNEVLARSTTERVARTTGTFVRNMLDPNGGLGSEVNNYLQDSVGEAAHYAAEAQKSAWELRRGIAEHAAKNNKTVDEVNADIGKRMEALASIASPVRREAALSNYVQANPELTPLLEGYRTIAAFSNKVADNVMARRPLTEADRKFAQNLRESAFAYTTRIYTSRQGEAGKSISSKMLRTATKAKTKLEQGKTLTKQEQEAFTRYDDAANYLMERLTIPPIEDLVGMRQSRINELFDTWADQDAARFREAAYDDAIRNGMDEETAKIAAKESMVEVLDGLRDLSQVERILNDKADMVIRSLLGLNASSPTASTVGGLREDRGILQKREELAPELRRLMGEVVADPSVMLSVTMAKQGELIARENFLRKLADTGMVTSQDLAGTGPFSEHTVKLRGDTAGSLKDMYTTPEVARVINAQLEMYSTVTDAAAISFMQSDAMAAALARKGVNSAAWLASKAKMSSVVLSPFAMAMNAAGSALMLLPNGVYSPGMMVDAMTAAKDSVMNTLREGSNYSDVLANAVRWNVIDSARLQELRRSVHDSLKDTVVNPSVQSKAWHKAKLGFGATTEVFAMTDSWTKIAAFIKQQDYLTKFYQAEGVKKTADEISSEAAAIVRNTNFTYSKVPPVIRNVFERTGLTMFATYFWSVPLAITGNYQQAFNDVVRASKATTAKGRQEATTMAISRFMGTNAAVAVVPILGQMLAQSLNGMGDEDEDKIKAMAGMLRDEQPYADPIYLGKDKEGKPLFFLFNRLDPYGPVTDLVRILGNTELENDKKYDAMKSLFMGMWFKNSAIVEAGKVLTSEERGNTSTRLERIPYIGAATREMQGVVGYADWARSLTTLVDRAFVPAFVNVLDPENPTVSDDYNSNLAAVLGMMTFASGGKAIKADPDAALRTIGFELKEAKDSARKRVAQAISNGDSPERIADMIMTESDGMFYDFERAQRTYEGMVNGLEMSPRAAAAILKSRDGAGMNDVQIGLIRRGLLRGDKEMALELAGILSKKSVEDRVARTRGYKEDKDQAVSDAQETLKILRRDYGLKVGE